MLYVEVMNARDMYGKLNEQVQELQTLFTYSHPHDQQITFRCFLTADAQTQSRELCLMYAADYCEGLSLMR